MIARTSRWSQHQAGRILAVLFASLAACSDEAPAESGVAAEALTQTLVGDVAATAMQTKSGGEQTGTIWAFYQNGYLAHPFTFPSNGTYDFTVRAFGSPASGVYPNLQIKVDGAVVGNINVNSTSLTAFTIKANVSAGVHTITIAFTNDLYTGAEDRNVWIAGLTITGGTESSCTPTPTATTTATTTTTAPTPPPPTSTSPTPPPPSPFDVKSFLAKYGPGLLHEGNPSGVPTSWDWATHSGTPPILTAPAGTGWLNWWSVAAVDLTQITPANTRVEFRDAKLLVLPLGSNTWVTYFVGSSIAGGGFKADFSGGCPYGGVSTGTTSITLKPPANCLDHFWPNNPAFVQIGSGVRAGISIASVRLVKANPSGPDDRANSHYLVQMGADWRSPDGACAKNASGLLVCTGIDGGRFIYPKTYWRSAVMSSLMPADLNSLPLPPASAFTLPDGTMPTE